MRIGFIMVRYPDTRKSPIMPEVVRLLTEMGVKVDLIYPEEQLTNLDHVRVEDDLYILKSGTELALSLAGALDAAGAMIINPYPVSVMLRDKIIATKVLQTAGLPVPETYVTAHPEQLAPLLDAGPLVLKPYRGSQGRGIHLVWDADELNAVPTTEGPVFAQRYHKPQGRDRKIYCIGGQVFGVKRIWPARTYEEKLGQPFTIAPGLHEIALQCGRAFGIEVYGFDVIMNDDHPYVVDMSSFPGFKGVPDAALRLADYIYAAGQRVLHGEPLLPAVDTVTNFVKRHEERLKALLWQNSLELPS
jgi:ribosomal protein S6--L-glutamate ligase